MRTYLLVALVSVLATSCGQSNAQDERSQNAIEFDSLVTIIKQDQEYIDLIASQSTESDSVGIVWNEILSLEFEEIVEKHDLDSVDQKDFLAALSVTAQIVEANLKLKSAFGGDDMDQMFSDMDAMMNEMKSSMERDSIIDTLMSTIWFSEKVQEFAEEFENNSNGERSLKMYQVDKGEQVEIRISEDNGMNLVTRMIFILSPNEDWKIEFYDTLNEKYIDFKDWNQTK